ncbi:MAG: hypothetical protein IT381_27225 [Deltaproteobacteria bacterium]|nr:hypothetical protein [Deltaproteobacteria bacterium]
MKYLLLGLCFSACGYINKGDACSTYSAQKAICNTGLVCCQPDPRVADAAGVCTEEKTLAKLNEACGVTSKLCCEKGLACQVDQATGNGRCVQ